MNNEWALLPMRASNKLLGDPDALAARLAEDSYLYFRRVIDPARLAGLRHQILEILADRGWILGGPLLDDGTVIGEAIDEGHDGFATAYDDVQRLQAFHELAHDEALLAVMRDVVGPTAFPHPLKVARLAFPESYDVSTPPHQDFPNNQGTPNLVASWIPLHDCPRSLGALAVMRGSHRFGLRELALHPGPGNRQAVIPPEMSEALRWVTTDFAAGDVLLFPSLTIHASLHNASEFNMRLSVDFRYQQEGEALTPLVLEPHFGRLSWEEIYAGWDGGHQYYWRDLDYQVVPFEQLTERGFEADPTLGLKATIAQRHQDGTLELTEDEWRTILVEERKKAKRLERRLERVARHTGVDPATPGRA